jgi:hypothetical protein
VGEPRGNVLVHQHVEQGQAGTVGLVPDPVVRVRPAERRVNQASVALRGVISSERVSW